MTRGPRRSRLANRTRPTATACPRSARPDAGSSGSTPGSYAPWGTVGKGSGIEEYPPARHGSPRMERPCSPGRGGRQSIGPPDSRSRHDREAYAGPQRTRHGLASDRLMSGFQHARTLDGANRPRAHKASPANAAVPAISNEQGSGMDWGVMHPWHPGVKDVVPNAMPP
jgi:hypothetical protein